MDNNQNPSVEPSSEPPSEADPFAPDAPIHHLLSVGKNPLVAQMDDKQLMELVQRMRTLAASPQTMSAKLQSESKGRKSKPLTPEQIKRKAMLDSL